MPVCQHKNGVNVKYSESDGFGRPGTMGLWDLHSRDALNRARSLSSLFADPERIMRRFYVFAEDPCKSTITTSEPCSPVFKEAQPRPSRAVNQFN